MPVDSTHPLYDEFLPKWTRARDVIAGEDRVKEKREVYLHRLDSQTDEEFQAYVNRASFFNAAGRTADGFSGMVFRRDPVVKLPGKKEEPTSRKAEVREPDGAEAQAGGRVQNGDSPDAGTTHAHAGVMELFSRDIDLLGTSLYSYVKHVAGEIMATGRGGTLVEWHDLEQRPFVCFYSAEQILNWRMERIAGAMMLSLVVLREALEEPGEDGFENVMVEQIRVLRLARDGAAPFPNRASDRPVRNSPSEESASDARPASEGAAPGGLRYVVEVWRKAKKANRPNESVIERDWAMVERLEPARLGRPLRFLPFVFHGPQNDLPAPSKPPLDDIITVNLDHYRLDADFKHGLHYTALPTAWVAGFDVTEKFKIGSSTAWITNTVGATAGFLEFKGQGLGTFEREKDRDERLMAILGSRMLESQKRVSESAEALSLRQAGESSVVANMSASISKGLTKVLRWAYWWCGTALPAQPDRRAPNAEDDPDHLPAELVSIELNKDFETATMSAQELVALVQAWQAGLMSHESALNLMRQGELLPPSRTNEEELDLIDARPAPALTQKSPRPGPRAALRKVHAAEAAEGGGSLSNPP